MLEQEVQNEWMLIAFFSRHLHPPKRKYSTFNREVLAVYLAILHFRYFLEACDLVICTDHKPLTFTFAKEADPSSAHQQRHLAYISGYTTAIEHVIGKDNSVAAALSRIVIGNIGIQVGLDYYALVLAQ